MEQEEMMEQITAARSPTLFHNKDLADPASRQLSSDPVTLVDGLSNGTCGNLGDLTADEQRSDVMSEISNSDLSLPEVCISTNSNDLEEEDMNHEVQQAFRIFSGFLLDKHKGITTPFLYPVGHQEAVHGIGGVRGWGQAQLRQSMCLQRMEEKFAGQEYETITEFVADFRLMLENCYRYHGVDHWISKQAQKLEIMLEQKLTLLSRTLREKTTLAVTSKGRFGAEEERGSGGTSTRRRLAPRSLTTITVGGHESVMVQALRLEEQQRAKEEKRQRELEKKEAEEMSAKEVEEWEQILLSQASPYTVDALWELPAIGHFLCLAQTALNLPEIVFFDLERCLLMPRCSLLLSKIMSSLLSPPQRRTTLHRRPALPYRRWESELRQRVMAWYRLVGASHDQPGRAEQLGLCHQLFCTLGEVSPLEELPFHLLPFYQRVWLLKGLCDHVYETQKSVQDAVLAQPIHECRESILGYDSKENAYIHFPHFCGADLRIYCQSPSAAPAFPFPPVWVKRIELEPGTEGDESEGMRTGERERNIECLGGSVNTGESDDFGKGGTETYGLFKRENGDEEERRPFKLWSLKKEETSESGSSDADSCDDLKLDLKMHNNSQAFSYRGPVRRSGVKTPFKEETVETEPQPKRLKREQGFSPSSVRTIDAETQEPCLSVGEHSYTGRSPARSANPASPSKSFGSKMEEERPRSSCAECLNSRTGHAKAERDECRCGTSGLATQVSCESSSGEERARPSERIWTKKKKRKKRRGKEQISRVKEGDQLQHHDRMCLSQPEAAKPAVRRVATTIKRKDRKKKHKTGKKLESSKTNSDEASVGPSFKLVCTSLDQLRDLISKTEDELDDLESTKKRLGRWYYKREAVKDLHSTLIRLLNELSPWEPKLVKAHQRNRLRLKKEFDDFKKHPEYNNFVREERVSSSSSDEEDERGVGKEMFSTTDHYRRSEEEDVVPRGLWSGANTKDSVTDLVRETSPTYVPSINLPTCTEKAVCLFPKAQTGTRNIASAPDVGPQSNSDPIPPKESGSPRAAGLPGQTPGSPRPVILHTTTGLPRGYTPIPTLLAKSVGNKVTLMKRPADCPGFNDGDHQSKGSSVSPPTSATTKFSKAQTSSSKQQQQVHCQPGTATMAAAPLRSPQAKPTQTEPKSPVQVLCKVPEGLGQLTKTEGSSSPVKISVHPVLNHSTGEKVMQQVVILASNILLPKTGETVSSLHQQQSSEIQVPVSKIVSPICLSTSVPGFAIPENRIPVQQVAPLKDARTARTPSPSVSPCQQQGILNPVGFKGTPMGSPQAASPQGISPNLPTVRSPSGAVSTDSLDSKADPKQELKTMCIRDSQSILVTTRGGNTGIVKVQTSSGHGGLGSLPTSPVITISPQFKAFLVSKASTLHPPSASSHTSSCTVPAPTTVSVAQTQNQVPKTFSMPTSPTHSSLAGCVPLTVPGSQAGVTTVAFSPGLRGAASSTVAKTSHFQTSLPEKPAGVTSPSSSGVPQVLTQAEISTAGIKRTIADERTQVTKFILVAPSSSPTSTAAVSTATTSSSAKALPGSRVMFISQPSATSPAAFVGSIPKQAMEPAAGGQLLTTTSPTQALKVGSSLGQLFSTEALCKVQNISLSSGVQIHLAGKTTTIGQTIGALSRSSSESTSVSNTHCPAAAAAASAPGPPPITTPNIITSSSSAQLASHPFLTTVSPLRDGTSFSTTPALVTLPEGNINRKHLGMHQNKSPSSAPVQVPTPVHGSHPQTSTPVRQPSCIQSGAREESSLPSSAPLTNTQTTTSAPFPTPIQQRVVINTSTPLAAGTQIILNNTRFVVPPQGLGPGSHVLIISSPQQVPSASTGTSVPPQGASHGTVAPTPTPVIPQTSARLSAVPATSSSVACSPPIGPSLLATGVKAVQLVGTPGQGSVLLPIKTPGVPRSPARTAPALAPPPPRLGSVPAFLGPAFHSALTPIRLPAGTSAECSSTVLPGLAAPLSLLPSPSAMSLSSPVLPLASTISSSPTVAGAHSQSSAPTRHLVSVTAPPGLAVRPQQTAVRLRAPSTVLSQTVLHAGQGGATIRRQVPAVMPPVFAGTRTQILPTVTVPPIVSTVSRTQTLPVATVPPIGSTVNSIETTQVGTTPPSGSTVFITPAQPIASLKTNATLCPPVVRTNQALGKLQSPALGLHGSVVSKLLISPDGAVLGTAQCQVNPAELTACPKPLDKLTPISPSGALHTHDSSLRPSQTDTK